jgi:hypothetical protein
MLMTDSTAALTMKPTDARLTTFRIARTYTELRESAVTGVLITADVRQPNYLLADALRTLLLDVFRRKVAVATSRYLSLQVDPSASVGDTVALTLFAIAYLERYGLPPGDIVASDPNREAFFTDLELVQFLPPAEIARIAILRTCSGVGVPEELLAPVMEDIDRRIAADQTR